VPTEHRKQPRKIASETLEVFDQLTDSFLGTVVNISSDGLMLLSSESLTTGSIYQLDLRLSRLVRNQSNISLGAEVIWSSEATQGGSYWSGFHIIDASDEVLQTIDELTTEWRVQE
jgi:hypothetical protein